MGKSFKILTISGIPIKLHWTFIGLLAIAYFRNPDAGLPYQMAFTGFMLVLFLCVTLHELGHSFAARKYGVKTVDIILSPIGGVARLTHLPSKPIQEFVIAVAGPLVNVVIAILLFLALYLTSSYGLEWDRSFYFLGNHPYRDNMDFVRDVMLVNIGLVVFNLAPAFPMDGGRMLRALLSIKFSRQLATQIASYIGQALAVVAIVYSLFIYEEPDYVMAAIGVFIFMSAKGEYSMVKVVETLKSFTAKDLMRTEMTTFYTGMTVEQAATYLIKDEAGDYILKDEAEVFQGVILRTALIDAIKTGPSDTPIETCQTKKVGIVHPSANFERLFFEMQDGKIRAFVVQENPEGEVLGIIDVAGVNVFLNENNIIKKHPLERFLNKKK